MAPKKTGSRVKIAPESVPPPEPPAPSGEPVTDARAAGNPKAVKKAGSAKADAKKAAGGDKPKAKKDDGPQLEDDEDIDPTKYFDNRLTWVNQRKTSGPDPYPHKFNVQLQLPDYHAKYASIADG